MKKFQLKPAKTLIGLIIMTSLVSCRKATVHYFNSPPQSFTGTPKVKTVDFGNGDGRTYEYDAAGRFLRSSHDGITRSEASYSTTTAETNSYTAMGVLAQKDMFTLNSEGLIGSSTNSNNLPSVFYYYYNSDKKIEKDTYYAAGILKRTRYYQYSNGNRVKDSVVEASSGFVTTYEYYTDVVSTTESVNMGTTMYGMGNKNAFKKIVTIYSDGTVTNRVYSKPELDAAGRVGKVSFSNNGAAAVIYSYTYY